MSSKPNFQKAHNLASEILVCSKKINTFPFLVISVIEELTDIRILTYGQVEKKLGIPRTLWESKDAEIKEQNGMFIIFYNEQITDKHRMAFSVLHELGHYYLQHDMDYLTKLKHTNKEKFQETYSCYEVEANYFAAQLLMPEQVISELIKKGKKITVDFLVSTFNVSHQAAEFRKKYLCNYYERKTYSEELSYDDIILMKFKTFIQKNCPKKDNNYYSREEEYEKQAERDKWQ